MCVAPWMIIDRFVNYASDSLTVNRLRTGLGQGSI
jgi:hypothetical protein